MQGPEQLLATTAGRPSEVIAAIEVFRDRKFQQVMAGRVESSLRALRARKLMLQTASLLHQAKSGRSQQLQGCVDESARRAKQQDESGKSSTQIFSPVFIAL